MKSFLLLVCFEVWVVGVVGCATHEALLPVSEDVVRSDNDRLELASRQFGEHRDQADFETAQTRWLEGDVVGCLDQLYQVVEREPEHLDARLLLVEALLAENRIEEAKRKIRPAVEALPEDERTQYLATLLLDARMNPNATVSKDPLADVLNSDFDVDAKLDSVRSIPSLLNPPQSEPIQRTNGPMSSNHVDPTVLPATAEFPLNVATDISPVDRMKQSNEPYMAQDRVLQEQSISEPFLDHATDKKPVFSLSKKASSEGLMDQGRRAFASGDPDLALGYFRLAATESPNDSRIPIQAAILCLQSNRSAQAVEFLEPAQKLSPHSAAIPRILGTAYYRLGDYPASKVALDKSLSLDKSNALSYFLLGCTNVKLGYRQSASRYFRLARMLDKGNTLD